ncbi:hypothetical protein WJX84_010174 [Apatococcus fuscideae]|uniref:Fibronectin type-III domain-containing protein n=1 Tax=Apatococcus fuscideae TaxID=2026836 RepID=A0AAW1SW12_9CHLO
MQYIGKEFGASEFTEQELGAAVQRMESKLDSSDNDVTVSQAEVEVHLRSLLQGRKVADWVSHSLSLPQYADAFRDNSITALDFPLLVLDGGTTLQSDLKVTSQLHRLQLTRAIKRVMLGLGEPPSAPRQLTCQCTACGAVTLSWQAPSQLGHPAMHKYRLARSSSSESAADMASWDAIFDEIDPADISVSNLHVQAGRYQYRLTAWNSYGWSLPVQASNCTVPAAACQNAPPHPLEGQAPLTGIFISILSVVAIGLGAAYLGSQLKGQLSGPAGKGLVSEPITQPANEPPAAAAQLGIPMQPATQPVTRPEWAEATHTLDASPEPLQQADPSRSLDHALETPTDSSVPTSVRKSMSCSHLTGHALQQDRASLQPVYRSLHSLPSAMRAPTEASDAAHEASHVLDQDHRAPLANRPFGLETSPSKQELWLRNPNSYTSLHLDPHQDVEEMDAADLSDIPSANRNGCAFPRCNVRFYGLGLKTMKHTLQKHYCCRCQNLFCHHHTQYSPHGSLGSCGLDSKCICVMCWQEIPPSRQELLNRHNKLHQSSPASKKDKSAEKRSNVPDRAMRRFVRAGEQGRARKSLEG